MRRLYLIRHGHPDFPLGAHMCLGHTDTPLGAPGRMQACALGRGLGDRGLTVFSSPLVRCLETAAILYHGIFNSLVLSEYRAFAFVLPALVCLPQLILRMKPVKTL